MHLLKQKIEQLSTVDIGYYDKNFIQELSENVSRDIVTQNALDRLIQLYEKSGFLYPAKKERISPYMDLILDNWKAALNMDGQLLNIVTFKGKSSTKEQLTSITFWRTTFNSWVAQHLVSTGFPVGVCAMMLRAQAEVNVERHRYKSFQNWFSESNKYANMVFGTLVRTIGKEHSCVNAYAYVAVKNIVKHPSQIIKIIPYQDDLHDAVYQLYCKIRGTIDAEAEEINDMDIELDQLDQLYEKVGLRRKRYIWLAMMNNQSQPVGMAVVNRAPFGLNFSILENRCDLLVDSGLIDSVREIICKNLMVSIHEAYFGNNIDLPYPVSFVPVITDMKCANILTKSGAELMRIYNKSIWMQQAFEGWYTHIQKTYEAFLIRRKNKLKIK